MKPREDNHEAGFTILEMLVTIAISSIIAYAIFLVMGTGQGESEQTQLKMFIQDSAREGVYKMAQEIRQSAPDRIVIGNAGNTIQFAVPDPASPVNPDFSVNWTNAHPIRYSLGGANNRQILRTDLATNQTSVMANDVTALSFTGNGANPTTVAITVRVQRLMRNNRAVPVNPLQLTAQAEIRNT